MSSHTYKSRSESSEDSLEMAKPSQRRKERDEPTSPLQVVFYVVCFYLIWQIFTRSDELEVMDHGSVGGYRASLRSSHLGDHFGANGYAPPYPQISTPSPPSSNAIASGGSSFTSIIFTTLLFPFVQLFNLIFFALHYVAIIMLVIAWSLHYLTLPITNILSVLVIVPFNALSRTASALYPLYVLLGGLVGIGVGMGVVAAWLGREIPRWILPRPVKKKRRRRPVPIEPTPATSHRGYYTEDEADTPPAPRASSHSSSHRSSAVPPAIALRKRAAGGRLR